MDRAQKEKVVEELGQIFESSGVVVVSHYEGMTVAEMQDLRARMRDGRAEVFKSEGSGRISGLSWAEGLVELPDGAAQIEPGDPVRYIPFGSFR